MTTFNLINRCLPQIENNATSQTFCELPSCTSVGEPCKTVVGVKAPVWEMSSLAQSSVCLRQVDVVQQTSVKQPNSAGVLETLLTFATTLNGAAQMTADNGLAILGFGIGVSTVLGLFWMTFLYLCAGFAVRLALVTVALMLTLLTVGLSYRAGVGGAAVTIFVQGVVNATAVNLQNQLDSAGIEVADGVVGSAQAQALVQETDEDWARLYTVMAAISALLTVLFLVVLCAAGSQIGRTVALVKEATRVVRNSKAMVFFPLIIGAAQLLLLLFCVLTLAFLHSSPAQSYATAVEGVKEDYGKLLAASALDQTEQIGQQIGDSAKEIIAATNATWTAPVVSAVESLGQQIGDIPPDTWLTIQDVFIGFMLIWTSFFLAAIGTTTISGCVVYFFYIDEDTSGFVNAQFADNQTDYVLLGMLWYVLRYNLGSMALGSLVLAVVETLVWLLEFVSKQTEGKQESNVVLRVAMKCCKCCMFCFERCLKFVSSYAYVFVFMQNQGFCTSCFRTWRLMTGYPVQLSINAIVQKVLFAMQSIGIPLVSTIWAYTTFVTSGTGDGFGDLTKVSPDTLVSAMAPSFLVFALSLLVSRSFASVYEQVINALTVCTLQDIEKYSARYARSQLRQAFDLPPKPFNIDHDDYRRRSASSPRK